MTVQLKDGNSVLSDIPPLPPSNQRPKEGISPTPQVGGHIVEQLLPSSRAVQSFHEEETNGTLYVAHTRELSLDTTHTSQALSSHESVKKAFSGFFRPLPPAPPSAKTYSRSAIPPPKPRYSTARPQESPRFGLTQTTFDMYG